MLAMLIAYDAAGNVVGTLDYRVIYDHSKPDKPPLGLVDFAAHEERGGAVTDFWTQSSARGAKAWPEWLGGQAHDFTVELTGPAGAKRLTALVHKGSGFRRERAVIEKEIAARIAATPVGEPTDLRDLLGGPGKPIVLDETGATATLEVAPSALPLIGVDLPPDPLDPTAF